jgi:hypothetical protein
MYANTPNSASRTSWTPVTGAKLALVQIFGAPRHSSIRGAGEGGVDEEVSGVLVAIVVGGPNGSLPVDLDRGEELVDSQAVVVIDLHGA